MIEALDPCHFDLVVASAKEVAGYNEEDKTYRAASLALHYGTTLSKVTDLARHLIMKKVQLLAPAPTVIN